MTSPPLIMAIIVGAAFAGIGWLLYGVARAASDGGIDRNRAVGIRLPTLMRSDEAWAAGHRAATPVFFWFAIIGSVSAAASALTTAFPVVYLCLLAVTFVAVIVGGTAGVLTADSAARRVARAG